MPQRKSRKPKGWLAPFYSNKKIFAIVGIVIFVAMPLSFVFGAVGSQGGQASSRTSSPGSSSSGPGVRRSFSAPPAMTIDRSKSYSATIETAKGNLKLELFPKDAPNTVNNFVFLARGGFYNGLTFHRVTKDLVEGGDPNGDGSGGPGYSLEAEASSRTLETGVISRPNTNGSQFSIATSPQAAQDGNHTVFGKVVEGMSALSDLSQRDIIAKVTIEEK